MPHSFTDATPVEQSIFLLFMILWIIYGILNQYASINEITFDAAQLVWTQEVLKIMLSLILFRIQDGNMIHLKNELKEHWSMILWYLIPAGLYALGDVLTYVNLRVFDPATLHLLGEMKLVVTAIVHQQLFRKMLNTFHWLALVIITAGCILKALDSMELSNASEIALENINTQSNTTTADSGEDIATTIHHHPTPTIFNYSLIGIHILITTVAGVFNEKLLKDKPAICINLQNLCLYSNGIILLSLGMIIEGMSNDDNKSISETFISYTSLVTLFSQPSVASMAIIMSIGGIVTSRFLKIFDSIRKSVATALVVVSLPLLSRLIFHTPITVKMIISILMVVLGMNIYTSQPPPARIDADGQTIKTKNSNAEEGGDENDESELFLPSVALPGRQHTIHDHDRNGNGSLIQEMSKIRQSNLTVV